MGINLPSHQITTVPPPYMLPYYFMYQCVCVFFTFARFSPAPVGPFSRSRLRGTPVHGANLGPGRAPWRVLWEFKVAKSDN